MTSPGTSERPGPAQNSRAPVAVWIMQARTLAVLKRNIEQAAGAARSRPASQITHEAATGSVAARDPSGRTGTARN